MAIFQACTLLGYVGIFTYDLDACDYAVMKGFTWRVVRMSSYGNPVRVLDKDVMPLYQPDNHDRYGLFISVHDICCADRPIGRWDMRFVHNFRESMDILYENADKIFVDVPNRIKTMDVTESKLWYGHVNGLPALLIPEDIGDTEANNIFRRYGLYATRVYKRGGELNSGVAFAVTEKPLKDDVFTIDNPKGEKMPLFTMFNWGKQIHGCISDFIDSIGWDEYHLSEGYHIIVTKERLPYSYDGKYYFMGQEVYRYDAIYNPEESQIINIESADRQKHPSHEPCGTIISTTSLERLESICNYEPLRNNISLLTFICNPALLHVDEREYRRIKICDVDCLITTDRLPYTNDMRIPISCHFKRCSDQKEITYLYRYDVRENDDDGEIGEIARNVVVNHGGTILSMEPLLTEGENSKLIDSMNDIDYGGDGSDISIRDYIVSKPE